MDALILLKTSSKSHIHASYLVPDLYETTQPCLMTSAIRLETEKNGASNHRIGVHILLEGFKKNIKHKLYLDRVSGEGPFLAR